MSAPDARVEMQYGGAFHDITADYDSRSAITTTVGASAEQGSARPTALTVPMENPDAGYSPLDPRGARFGLIGVGTLLRLRIGAPQPCLSIEPVRGAYASTPDAAALDITGDLDVRVELRPDTWRPDATYTLIAKWRTDGNASWSLRLLRDGRLLLSWSPDGSNGAITTRFATTAVPADTGRLAVRVTVDVDNGAAGHTVRFYSAPSLAGPWTQLGADVVTAGTTSLFAGAADLELGRANDGSLPFTGDALLAGRVYAAEVRDGINGAVVAAPDLTVLDTDVTTFTDAVGLEWTVHGRAVILDPSIRAAGRIKRFAPSWDRTTRDARMTLTATGPLESLSRDEPLRSSLFRDLSTKANTSGSSIVAYWPMEDAAGSTALASGIVGHPPMVPSGAVNLASYGGFDASGPIPTLTAPGGSAASYANGVIPAYVGETRQRVIGLVHVPDGGVSSSNRAVVTVRTTGTTARWVVAVTPAGDLIVTAFDGDNIEVLNTGPVAFEMNGRHVMLSLLLSQDGADIDWQVSTFDVSGVTGAADGTLAGRTYGRCAIVQAGPSLDLAGTAIGHLAVLNGDVDSIWDLVGRSLVAWAGETAGERIDRLTGEAGIPLRLIGDPADGELVGAQGLSTLLTLLDDAANVDMGLLGERHDHPSLQYRTRASLYNQTPALELDAADGNIANPFDPPLDTQATRNDITVTRVGGSSYRAVDETAAAERFPDPVTLNLHSDNQLLNQATWRLFLGTVNEHRVASLVIEMHHNPNLVQAILDLEVGGLIRIHHPPPGLPPGPLDLIARGWSDRITDQTWYVTINCSPGSPWQVAAVSDGSDEQRVDTAGSEVAVDFDAGTDTSLSVAVTQGPLWTTDPSQFPLQIQASGVVLEVTEISGASSPQTFTVTAEPVNGVAKTIPAGTDVRLAVPPVIGL